MAALQFDLVTVGGGLGASSLGKAMAENGARVLILEQEARFRDRIRGELLTSWGVNEARELGVFDSLLATCAVEVPWVDLGFGPRDLRTTTLQRSAALSYVHPEMQEALLGAAENAGAQVRRGVAVRSVETGGSPVVTIESEGCTEHLPARLVVACDGSGSQTRKWAGFKVARNSQPFLLAGVLLTNVASRQDLAWLVFNFTNGMTAAVIPVGRNRFRAYLGYPAAFNYRLQGQDDFPMFCAESAKALPPTADFYADAKTIGPLASFDGGDSWVEHPYGNGIALIGDAASTSDPTFGQGMALTLRDARTLRDHLLRDSNWDRAGHRYAEDHDAYFRNCHAVTKWIRTVMQDQAPEACLIRARALPLIFEDATRVPDHLFSGPDLPTDDAVRARFFGEA